MPDRKNLPLQRREAQRSPDNRPVGTLGDIKERATPGVRAGGGMDRSRGAFLHPRGQEKHRRAVLRFGRSLNRRRTILASRAGFGIVALAILAAALFGGFGALG